ncbi:bifunctional DNA primase/polymerase [Streptomyces massasporeus]
MGFDDEDAGPSSADVGLDLLRCGFVIIPLDHPSHPECRGAHGPKNPCDGKRGKHPLGQWAESKGFPTACRTPEDVFNWATGRSVNWGILTGPSNLVVLDEDSKDGMALLCAALGIEVPDTLCVDSGRDGGGRHYYFRPPAGHTIRTGTKLGGREIDWRGEGGMVIAPGSTHQTGRVYAMVEPVRPIRPFPAEFVRLIEAEKERRKAEKAKARSASVPGQRTAGLRTTPSQEAGGRHNHTVSYAGWALSKGIPLDLALSRLRAQWETYEQPPGNEYTWEAAEADLRDVYERYADDTEEIAADPVTGEIPDDGAAPAQEPSAGDDMEMYELRLERARRRAKRIVDAEEIRRVAEDPAYEATQYQAEYVREKARMEAKKRVAAELRIEEPTTDLGDVYDELANESAADRRPQVGYVSDDDCGLFYAGTSNGIFGDGGIGKTLIEARLQVEVMQRGQSVVHWEFDNNSDRAIVRRLKNAGATRDQVVKQFRVLRAEEDVETLPAEFVDGVGLVTLDAITPAITALGAEVNHPSGMDMALRAFMAPFTTRGAVGVFIGHTGHENKDRQAGSTRMFAAVQGALYQATVIRQPEIGACGLVALKLAKDNQGWAGPVGQISAYVTYDSTAGDGSLNVYFTRQRDVQGAEDAKREQFTARLDKARLTEQEEIDLLLKVMAAEPTALNVAALHTKTSDMGLRISERKIKARLQKMTEDGLIFVDRDASTAAASVKGGRPSDHYRATAASGTGNRT